MILAFYCPDRRDSLAARDSTVTLPKATCTATHGIASGLHRASVAGPSMRN